MSAELKPEISPIELGDLIAMIELSRLSKPQQRQFLEALDQLYKGAEKIFYRAVEEEKGDIYDGSIPEEVDLYIQISDGKNPNNLTPSEEWLWIYGKQRIFSSKQLPMFPDIEGVMLEGKLAFNEEAQILKPLKRSVA